MISLDDFLVLKKLCVKDIQIKPDQVKARYVVENLSGDIHSCELIYSYEHPFFNRNRY